MKGACSVLAFVVAIEGSIALYDYLLGRHSPVGELGWAASLATIASLGCIDLVLLVGLGSFTEGRWLRLRPVPVLVQLAAMVVICTAGGLIAVSLIAVNVWGIGLFVAMAVALSFAYRATVVSGQRYANLEKLYSFTRRLSEIPDCGDVMAMVVGETASLLKAARVELVVELPVPAGSIARCAVHGEGQAHFDQEESWSDFDRRALVHAPLLVNAHSEPADLVASLADRGVTEAMIAPLQGDNGVTGYLLAADKQYGPGSFTSADLRFFEALAANAGVALHSGELLAKLRVEIAERQYQARHDPLTGLPNRLAFNEGIEEELAAGQYGTVAVMLLDLDGFKDINDTLGHVTGDAILKEVGRRLAPFSEEGLLVARLGGDEFAVLLSSSGPDDLPVMIKAKQVMESITQVCSVEGMLLDIRASMGVAVGSRASRSGDAATLLRHADVAMYLAKEAGGGIRAYEPAEDRSTMRRLTLATELRRAIERESLDLWYQPVVHLASGEVLGCEALLRWSHEQFGPISPVEFIPVAESAGLIDPLTWWVLERALAQVKEWRSMVPHLTMAVNLSARSLAASNVPAKVSTALRRAAMPPEALTLELTESCMVNDPKSSERAMHRLKDLGVGLSIDDYGTGFSSLSRLKDLPFRDLKIDRSFVKEMIRDKGDEAIVRSTIELARSLGRTVTAEGVEDKATLHRLATLGCHHAQGYYLARPLPALQCEVWLGAFVRWPSTVGEPGSEGGSEGGETGALWHPRQSQ